MPGCSRSSQLAWGQDPVTAGLSSNCGGENTLKNSLVRLDRKISKPARTVQFRVKTSALILYPAKCSMKRILSELNPYCWLPSRSFRISDRIYSLKLMESELAFRFASRCNAAGKVIAIRREIRRGRPVLFAPLAPRAPRLLSCIRCTYIVPNAVVQL